MITFTKGNLFESDADTLVNATNTEGVMGGGIALAFKEKYPWYFTAYKARCEQGMEKVGRVVPYYEKDSELLLFSLHTKDKVRENSKYEHVVTGLVSLRPFLSTTAIDSIAIPALGCGLGGLDWDIVKVLIPDVLENVDCDIKVYEPL